VLSSVPLYRLWNGRAADHFYTTSAAERQAAIAQDGYSDEGIAAWVYPVQVCGGVPLYRAYSPAATDHFYTASHEELLIAVGQDGYVDEGIAAYVLPA
ncbi:hypothetical protein EVG20_g11489, partial [Dentipellis fragilis]